MHVSRILPAQRTLLQNSPTCAGRHGNGGHALGRGRVSRMEEDKSGWRSAPDFAQNSSCPQFSLDRPSRWLPDSHISSKPPQAYHKNKTSHLKAFAPI